MTTARCTVKLLKHRCLTWEMRELSVTLWEGILVQ